MRNIAMTLLFGAALSMSLSSCGYQDRGMVDREVDRGAEIERDYNFDRDQNMLREPIAPGLEGGTTVD